MPIYFYALLCGVLFFTGCDSPPADETALAASASPLPTAAERPLVKLHTATSGRLPLRRQASGILRARRRIVVKSPGGGRVTRAPTEGAYYREGQVLFATDPRPLELARDRAAAARDEAAFRQRDLLLRLSANLLPGDTTSVTDLARANVLQQSGLPAAEVALAETEYNLALARLTAPFGGRAADVSLQVGSQVTPGEDVCTLIDPGSLEVEFSLLEQELGVTDRQARLTVTPVALPDLRLPAVLDILNPTVDAGGLLRARARLTDYGKARLYPGMNVTVTLEQDAPTTVLIPKAALVTRSGRTLVFTYDADSETAEWQYVTVGYENDELVGLTEGVEAGQAVIVGGNLTLDHGVGVRVE